MQLLCKKCGLKKVIIIPDDNKINAYCENCGRFIRSVSEKELNEDKRNGVNAYNEV